MARLNPTIYFIKAVLASISATRFSDPGISSAAHRALSSSAPAGERLSPFTRMTVKYAEVPPPDVVRAQRRSADTTELRDRTNLQLLG